MNNITLGIDQSFRSTGIVVMDDNIMLDFQCIKTDKTHDNFHRVHHIKGLIHNCLTAYAPEVVFIEGLSFSSQSNISRDLGGLQYTIVILSRYKHFIKTHIVTPTSLKKYATGTGKAKKEDMIDALPEHIRSEFMEKGYKKTTGMADLADAYHLATFDPL